MHSFLIDREAKRCEAADGRRWRAEASNRNDVTRRASKVIRSYPKEPRSLASWQRADCLPQRGYSLIHASFPGCHGTVFAR
jgi:hypothetical protein